MLKANNPIDDVIELDDEEMEEDEDSIQVNKLPRFFKKIDFPLYSVYSGDPKSNHLKSGLFEGQISNGLVIKWSGFSYGYSDSPNHLKTRQFIIRTFLSRFHNVLF